MYFLVFLNFRLLVSLLLSNFNLAAFLPYLCKFLIFVQNDFSEPQKKNWRHPSVSHFIPLRHYSQLEITLGDQDSKKGFKNPNRASPQVMRCLSTAQSR